MNTKSLTPTAHSFDTTVEVINSQDFPRSGLLSPPAKMSEAAGAAQVWSRIYTAEADRVDKSMWTRVLEGFDDANIFQTWSYAAARWGERSLNHVLLKQGAEVVAAVQVIVIRLPLLGAGMAYVKSGPLCQLRGRERNLQAFRQMLRVLRNIYVTRQGLLLRIFPNFLEDGPAVLRSILTEEGFERDQIPGPCKTAIIDLSYSREELRKSLKRTWRQNLARAETCGLKVIGGTSDELLEKFIALHRQMRTRKRRKVGCPTAAVIRRTCRFFPSTSTRPIQQVGTVLRKRTGGTRGGKSGWGSRIQARHGSVLRPATNPPLSRRRSASAVGTRSTCAQYSR